MDNSLSEKREYRDPPLLSRNIWNIHRIPGRSETQKLRLDPIRKHRQSSVRPPSGSHRVSIHPMMTAKLPEHFTKVPAQAFQLRQEIERTPDAICVTFSVFFSGVITWYAEIVKTPLPLTQKTGRTGTLKKKTLLRKVLDEPLKFWEGWEWRWVQICYEEPDEFGLKLREVGCLS